MPKTNTMQPINIKEHLATLPRGIHTPAEETKAFHDGKGNLTHKHVKIEGEWFIRENGNWYSGECEFCK